MKSVIILILMFIFCIASTTYGEILSPIKISFFIKTLDVEDITVVHRGKTVKIPKKLVSPPQLRNLRVGDHQYLEFNKVDFEAVKAIITSKN